jgi:hypothetical protein
VPPLLAGMCAPKVNCRVLTQLPAVQTARRAVIAVRELRRLRSQRLAAACIQGSWRAYRVRACMRMLCHDAICDHSWRDVITDTLVLGPGAGSRSRQVRGSSSNQDPGTVALLGSTLPVPAAVHSRTGRTGGCPSALVAVMSVICPVHDTSALRCRCSMHACCTQLHADACANN